MKETNQLRNLMEAVQLNEYLVRPGDPVSDLLGLNIFVDAENKPSDFEEEFRNSPEWIAVENKYYRIANNIANAISKTTRTLTDDDVDAIHDVWYDGSDAYADPEEAVHSLPGIYKSQLNVIRDILLGGGNEQ